MISSVTSGKKRKSWKISKIPWLWPSTKIKAAKLTAEIAGASHSLHCCEDSFPIHPELALSLCQKPIYLKPDVDFAQGTAWSTWLSQWEFQEKCIEQNLDLYSIFIDLTKAFDTVNREALWSVVAWYSCLWKFIQMIRLFHVGMTGQILSSGYQSNIFRSPIHWSKDVSWCQSFSTCSSPVSSTMLCRVLMRECISATTLMVPYSAFANSQPSQRHWLTSCMQCCLPMTAHS